MRVLLQRVTQSKVDVDGTTVGQTATGLLLFVGFGAGDDERKLRPMAEKIANMRLFPSEKSHFDRSLLEVGGGLLAVPQFTLYADTSKGRRPDFTQALHPEEAKPLFDQFVATLSDVGVAKVEAGTFGAHMHVLLENDGPVTIMVEI